MAIMKTQKIEVEINGLSDIMFDKFIDHSKEIRPPEQKLYIAEKNKIVFPTENFYSFMFCENPQGCAKKFEGKKGKNYISVGQGHVFIDPVTIPFKNGNGKDIIFETFDDSKQKQFWIHEGAPRTKQGSLSIKQEVKQRPVLRLPWSLSFTITLVENNLIDESKLHNWFIVGGLQIGIGTYRPRFGRFDIEKWEVS
jgi:hypothetical protein